MAVINTNVKALFSQAALASSNRAQSTAMQQLSTGKRINSARDDAAGMAIATRMTHQIRSLNQAVRNAGDAITLIQTAEGATGQITDMLQRMRELAVQAANDTNSNDQRSYLDLEFQQLKKQIVQISENTEWNGFPVLNGTAGEIVGPMPVYKDVGNGLFDATVNNAVGSKSSSVSAHTLTTSGTGTLSKAGRLDVTIATGAASGTAVFTMEDGKTVNLTATVSGSTVTFTNQAITDNSGTFVITSSAALTAGEKLTVQIDRTFATIEPMHANDVIINGVQVPMALAKNDTLSPAQNAASSAHARAAAINEVYDETGVRAVVQDTVMTGTSMTGSAITSGASTGTVTINGYVSAEFTTVQDNTRASRENVVKAINMISDKTGVVAVDTGQDEKGVVLKAADGRNIQIAFNTADTAATFATRSGLKQGLQIGSYALESKVETPVKITTSSNGVVDRAGLMVGDFSQNVTRMTTAARTDVQPAVKQVTSATIGGTIAVGDDFTLVVNGQAKTVTAAGTTISAVRSAMITAINNDSSLNVTATAGRATGEILLTAATPGIPFTISSSKDSTAGTLSTATVTANSVSADKPLKAGDLVINGVAIPASLDTGDLSSQEVASSSNKSSSALAIASAINSKTDNTGVKAEAVAPVMSATSAVDTTVPATGYYTVFMNGVGVTVLLTTNETADERLNNIINAVKIQAGQTGVVASKNAAGGLDLSTNDGRNLSVWFDANVEGLTAAALGLENGTRTAQVSTITTSGTPAVGSTNTVVINGQSITATSTGTSATQMATDLAAAINSAMTDPVKAPYLKNLSVSATGAVVTVTSTVAGSGFDLAGAASSAADLGVTIATTTANSAGNADVLAIRGAGSNTMNGTVAPIGAKTLYGTVRLVSDKKFTVEAGTNGFGSSSNFTALGFTEGTFGGRSSADLSPPRVGRMSFQVGAEANQFITFDLADFGKGGPITQSITWDVDLDPMKPGDGVPTPGQENPIFNGAKLTRSFISSKEAALDVLTKLDSTMDKVNATRATMGAVMNRLDHVVTNLTNVSMNLSASRSQIEDADYAQASTELAKTQIMQQAATAVLAQANTSQQSVLKLLQGG